MTTEARELLVASIAMSLYQYNVSAAMRAESIYDHFAGHCAEPMDLLRLVDSKHWATEMALPTAHLYLQRALARYAKAARDRLAYLEEEESHVYDSDR